MMGLYTDGTHIFLLSCFGIAAWPIPNGSTFDAERLAAARGATIAGWIALVGGALLGLVWASGFI